MNKEKNNNGDIVKRIKFIKYMIISSFTIMILNLYYIQIIKNENYIKKYEKENIKTVKGSTAPRGRIYDRNGILLVDNKPKKEIIYLKKQGVTKKEEFEIAKKVASYIEVDITNISNNVVKDYYIAKEGLNNLITNEEWELYKDRKLTDNDIYELKLERIKDISHIDKEEAYIYYLMNQGYKYEEKIIKDYATDYEYAIIAENMSEIKGFDVKLGWERYYYYDLLKSILGTTGTITLDNLDYYKENGHGLNDIVGTSYLEYQYDKYLKGEKDVYEVYNNSYKLVEEGTKGNDLYLTIDILMQQELEKIVEENLKEAQKEKNTKYLNKQYAIISNPQTGEIIAMVGKMILNDKVYDYTNGIITSTITPGSTVKGASHIVGYNNGGLKIGEVRDDSCIKLKNTKEKCSIRYLGTLNDITALKYSSNTYQFRTAIKVGGGIYKYDSALNINTNAFDIYRQTFESFGLGTLTNIDLPNEKLGYKGTSTNPGHLLDLSIGQYDTYTPIQMMQYINTFANNGTKLKRFIVKYIKDNNNNVIFENKNEETGKVNSKEEYINRTKEGFKAVLEPGGTGYNYINSIYKPAGKTGTSQSFIDTDNDGNIDTGTISTAFLGYAPYNNPTVSFTVITPDVSIVNNNDYISMITKRTVQDISNAYFSIVS